MKRPSGAILNADEGKVSFADLGLTSDSHYLLDEEQLDDRIDGGKLLCCNVSFRGASVEDIGAKMRFGLRTFSTKLFPHRAFFPVAHACSVRYL